jgi:hypothetical protein
MKQQIRFQYCRHSRYISNFGNHSKASSINIFTCVCFYSFISFTNFLLSKINYINAIIYLSSAYKQSASQLLAQLYTANSALSSQLLAQLPISHF